MVLLIIIQDGLKCFFLFCLNFSCRSRPNSKDLKCFSFSIRSFSFVLKVLFSSVERNPAAFLLCKACRSPCSIDISCFIFSCATEEWDALAVSTLEPTVTVVLLVLILQYFQHCWVGSVILQIWKLTSFLVPKKCNVISLYIWTIKTKISK